MEAQSKMRCFPHSQLVLSEVFILEPSQFREKISHKDGFKSKSWAKHIKGKITISTT